MALGVDRAQVVADDPARRLRGQHEVELGGGAVEIALLEIDEPHLDARLARVAGGLLQGLELAQRLVELLLPGVDAGQPPAHGHALRVERQDTLVELDGLVGPALQLVRDREVGQDQL